jgi:hypothetical protein
MLEKDIGLALEYAEKRGFGFTPMALDREALRALAGAMNHGRAWRVLELGGGTSTVFWEGLAALADADIGVTTLEHDPGWFNTLQDILLSPRVRLSRQRLRRIDDAVRERMFADPDHAAVMWNRSGEWVPEREYHHFTIRNAFYGDLDRIPASPGAWQALVLDGPHGNGRSLAFPLLANVLAPDAFVLVDDFDHYPFLDDLGRIFRFRELRRVTGTKRWVLLELQGRIP